jgi:uncharacterized LabA/DUF88 family protein
MAYIDGFSLYYGMKGQRWERYLWLNVDALARLLTRAAARIVGVKYFTAMVYNPPGDPDKVGRQARYNAAIRSTLGVRIIYGHYKPRQCECKGCGRKWTSYEEKQTDVNIALEVLGDAQDDRFDVLLLITRDGDLVSVLRTIRQRFGHKRIIVAAPPGRASPDLPRVADAYIHITDTHLRACQFPDEVRTAKGAIVNRPATWR